MLGQLSPVCALTTFCDKWREKTGKKHIKSHKSLRGFQRKRLVWNLPEKQLNNYLSLVVRCGWGVALDAVETPTSFVLKRDNFHDINIWNIKNHLGCEVICFDQVFPAGSTWGVSSLRFVYDRGWSQTFETKGTWTPQKNMRTIRAVWVSLLQNLHLCLGSLMLLPLDVFCLPKRCVSTFTAVIAGDHWPVSLQSKTVPRRSARVERSTTESATTNGTAGMSTLCGGSSTRTVRHIRSFGRCSDWKKRGQASGAGGLGWSLKCFFVEIYYDSKYGFHTIGKHFNLNSLPFLLDVSIISNFYIVWHVSFKRVYVLSFCSETKSQPQPLPRDAVGTVFYLFNLLHKGWQPRGWGLPAVVWPRE